MKQIAIGIALIIFVILVGMIRVDDATWTHYRLIFPASASFGIVLGISLILYGSFASK